MNKETIKNIISILIAGIPYFIVILSSLIAGIKKLSMLSKNTFNYGRGLVEQSKQAMDELKKETERTVAELKSELTNALTEVKDLSFTMKEIKEQNAIFRDNMSPKRPVYKEDRYEDFDEK